MTEGQWDHERGQSSFARGGSRRRSSGEAKRRVSQVHTTTSTQNIKRVTGGSGGRYVYISVVSVTSMEYNVRKGSVQRLRIELRCGFVQMFVQICYFGVGHCRPATLKLLTGGKVVTPASRGRPRGGGSARRPRHTRASSATLTGCAAPGRRRRWGTRGRLDNFGWYYNVRK